MNSLRQKITFGYAAIGALVVALSVLSLLELRMLEQKILAGERVGEFFDITLEIRRFEKNHFLYRQPADLAENRAYVKRARELLASHSELFEALTNRPRVADLTRQMTRYATLMETYGRDSGDSDGSDLLEADIRQAGKEIVTVAEELADAERVALQAQLAGHRRVLIVSVVLVAALVILIGQLLSRRVVRPLKRMEASMAAVAAGQPPALDLAADDREIASLTQAFERMLRELETRQGQLLRSEKLAALGTLLSGVAHELNNPLSNISSSCEILTEEISSHDLPFKKELLGQILDETWRARRIVRSLLDYARDREFRREPVPVARLLEDTLRLIKGQIPANVSIDRRVAEDVVVSGDRQRMQQLFFNLIGNALEALGGAGEIVISARRATEPPPSRALVFGQCGGPGDVVEIEIRDNGHGMSADVLPRIFDPFFTTKEVGRGLGLGLFIVFEIVEEHGGCIAVESEPGKGTTFFVRIPTEERK
jgi:signal transduction histidine kinase